MELQISELVSAIKKDGIDNANKEAEVIISNAKKQAESIIESARNEALKLKDTSEKEIKVFENSAKANAEQAKRDAVLSFKNEINKELEKILLAKVNKALDEKNLATLIKAVLTGEDMSKYAAEVKDAGESLKAELADEMKKGLEIRTASNNQGGFKIVAKDDSGYFDCSDDEIKNMLMPYFRDICL